MSSTTSRYSHIHWQHPQRSAHTCTGSQSGLAVVGARWLFEVEPWAPPQFICADGYSDHVFRQAVAAVEAVVAFGSVAGAHPEPAGDPGHAAYGGAERAAGQEGGSDRSLSTGDPPAQGRSSGKSCRLHSDWPIFSRCRKRSPCHQGAIRRLVGPSPCGFFQAASCTIGLAAVWEDDEGRSSG